MAARNTDADNVLVLTRVFDAPRELVWKVWTEADHVSRWWGPRGFTTTVTELDLRPGGRSRYVMHGPDGAQYPVTGVFKEVVPYEKIVTTDEFDADFPGVEDLPKGIVLTALFNEHDGKTTLTLRIWHPTAESKAKHLAMGVVTGWQSSFDCMDDHLADVQGNPTADRAVELTRRFDAPRQLVWDAWTKPEHVRKWYGLRVLTMTRCDSDLRPGGRYRQVLRDPAGNEFAFSGEYLEVFEPVRIRSTWGFEGVPGPPAISTVMFREADGQTEVWTRTVFPTAAGKQGWAASGGEAGMNETLDRLAELLRELTG